LKDSVNSVTKNLGAPTLTQGSVICSGDVVSSGQVRSQDVTTLLIASNAAMTLDVSLGQVFKITVIAGYSSNIYASNILPGSHVYLIITVLAGTSGGSMTFQPMIKAISAFDTSTVGVYTIHFICDNTYLYELGRTAALV